MTKYELLVRVASLACDLDELLNEAKGDKDITADQYMEIEKQQYYVKESS